MRPVAFDLNERLNLANHIVLKQAKIDPAISSSGSEFCTEALVAKDPFQQHLERPRLYRAKGVRSATEVSEYFIGNVGTGWLKETADPAKSE